MRLRNTVAGLLVLVAVAAGTAGCSSASATPFAVTGYASTGATTDAQLAASRKAMTIVGVDGVTLTSDGAGVSPAGSANLALLRESHHIHKTAELLVSNYSDAIGDFDSSLVARMLNSPAARTAVIQALATDVRSQGWDGITIDLESLNNFGASGHTRDDNAGLVAFAKDLRAALGKKSISICLSATTGSYKDLGYDVSALGHSVDHVVLMAYDQHGPSWSSAGPIGGYPWVKASLRALIKGVPAAKVQLGIGEYGYSWPAGSVDGTPRGGGPYTDAAARALVKKEHVTARWDATQQEWHATLPDGTSLWWSDARSYQARVALAHSLGLGGVAVWSLGQGDPLS
jgi:spore germination protein